MKSGKIIGIIKRAAVCLLVCAAVVGAAYAVLYALGLTDLDREKIQKAVESAGAFAPIAFILVSFLQVTFIPIPSTVTVLAGAYLFGGLESFFYSYAGILLGAVVAFLLGRGVGRPFASWVVGGEDELASWISKLKGRERALLWIMFFCPFFPDDALCAVAGVVKVSTAEFLLMQLITRVTSIGATLLFMSGELIPYEGWGLVLIIAGVVLFAAASVLALVYFERIDGFARRLADRITGRFKKQ